MTTKKPEHPLKASELERFDRNLDNLLKLDPMEAMYHRFHGILESQVVTLQILGVITGQCAVKLHTRIGDAMREKSHHQSVQSTEGLKQV